MYLRETNEAFEVVQEVPNASQATLALIMRHREEKTLESMELCAAGRLD